MELNIGLQVGRSGERIPADVAMGVARYVLGEAKFRVEGDTLVVLTHRASITTIYELAEALAQDCIAVRSDTIKELIGPRSDEWGAFDESLFVRFHKPRFLVDVTLVLEVEADTEEEAEELAAQRVKDVHVEGLHDVSTPEVVSEQATCSRCGGYAPLEGSPEGESCSECGSWVCESCIDWKFMSEKDTENPVCKECTA